MAVGAGAAVCDVPVSWRRDRLGHDDWRGSGHKADSHWQQ